MSASGFGIISLIIATTGAFGGQAPGITADYVEARSNHVFGCYCEWSGENITSGREVALAWAFKSGEFQGVPLAGVRLAALIVAQSSMSSGDPPRQSVIFVDPATPGKRRKAAVALVGAYFSQLFGQVLAVREVPVEIRVTAETAELSAGSFLLVAMRKARLPEDAMQGAKPWYEPFIPMAEPNLGNTLHNRYTGQDFDRHWDFRVPAITGYYGLFSIPAPSSDPSPLAPGE